MKAKPIEPGCRFIETEDWYTGTAVRFIDKPMGTLNGAPPSGWWLCDWDVSIPNDKFPDCHESIMIRIDDPDIEKQLKQEREKEHV